MAILDGFEDNENALVGLLVHLLQHYRISDGSNVSELGTELLIHLLYHSAVIRDVLVLMRS